MLAKVALICSDWMVCIVLRSQMSCLQEATSKGQGIQINWKPNNQVRPQSPAEKLNIEGFSPPCCELICCIYWIEAGEIKHRNTAACDPIDTSSTSTTSTSSSSSSSSSTIWLSSNFALTLGSCAKGHNCFHHKGYQFYFQKIEKRLITWTVLLSVFFHSFENPKSTRAWY